MLAAELGADQLTVDDREGRRLAEERGIPVMGTLGVLKEAAGRRVPLNSLTPQPTAVTSSSASPSSSSPLSSPESYLFTVIVVPIVLCAHTRQI